MRWSGLSRRSSQRSDGPGRILMPGGSSRRLIMRWMWIDRIVELVPGKKAVAIKNVTMAEEHLHDHFPAGQGRPALPVMPASLIIEGMAQTAGILVGHAVHFK